jgi:hypothetical protein
MVLVTKYSELPDIKRSHCSGEEKSAWKMLLCMSGIQLKHAVYLFCEAGEV